MRNYVRKKENPYLLPHNIYMQMLYLIRDYSVSKTQGIGVAAPQRRLQWEAVEGALADIKEQYAEQYPHISQPDFLQAFTDYAYFSCFYAQCRSNDGASRRSWSLFRSRLTYLVAERLRLTGVDTN